jgi:hypothetical protein
VGVANHTARVQAPDDLFLWGARYRPVLIDGDLRLDVSEVDMP